MTSLDWTYLQEFVKQVLTVIANDDTGVTGELEDTALNAGAILLIEQKDMQEILDRG